MYYLIPMDKIILRFISYNSKYLLGKYSSKKKKNFLNGKGDLDFYDKNRKLRKSFEILLKKKNYIIIKRYHKTGLRIDALDEKLNLYCLDFLNGIETNPFFFNLYKGNKIKKINSIKINIHLFDLLKIFINFVNHLIWRLESILNQKPTLIECFGVDGAGKTYLSNKIYSKFKGNISIYKLHLWKFKNKNINYPQLIPYKHDVYNLIFSLLKEIFILLNILILYLKINTKNFKKTIYIFDRSCWDVFIDPSRYRLNHNPYIIKLFLIFFLKNSYKFFLKRKYSIIKKRKNEINYKRYNLLNKNLRKFFSKYTYFSK